jgi:hypothetical protein
MTAMSDVYKSDEMTALLAAKKDSKNPHDIPPHICEWFSDESLEVLRCFGLEAPALLNKYTCKMEDALLSERKLGIK